MPTDPKYEYDVFISYKSEDRPWADKLYSDLQSKGLVPFIDHKRLEAGREWEPQLAVALGRSEHLVVLWSDEADRSSWVRKQTDPLALSCASLGGAGYTTESSRSSRTKKDSVSSARVG